MLFAKFAVNLRIDMNELPPITIGALLDRSLWTLINALNLALKEQNIDLQHSQYIVMRVLFRREGISQNEIAAYLHKDAAAIKRSIDYLEKKGFVIKKSLSGCKYGIYLTDNGKERKSKIISVADEAVDKVLSGISETTYQEGVKFLEYIIRDMEK